jgi:hypothetical protein
MVKLSASVRFLGLGPLLGPAKGPPAFILSYQGPFCAVLSYRKLRAVPCAFPQTTTAYHAIVRRNSGIHCGPESQIVPRTLTCSLMRYEFFLLRCTAGALLIFRSERPNRWKEARSVNSLRSSVDLRDLGRAGRDTASIIPRGIHLLEARHLLYFSVLSKDYKEAFTVKPHSLA